MPSSPTPAPLPSRRLDPEELLSELLPEDWALPLTKAGLATLEDLYDCAASLGSTWHRSFPGLGSRRAKSQGRNDYQCFLHNWGRLNGVNLFRLADYKSEK